MRGFGEVHDYKGDGSRETRSKPLERRFSVLSCTEIEAEYRCDYDTYKGAKEVAEDERSWLS